MEKTLFQNLTPAERLTALNDNADRVEQMPFMKAFTPDQIVDFKEELSEVVVNSFQLATKKAAVIKEFADQEKPLKERQKELSQFVRDKAVLVPDGEVFVFLDQDDQSAYIYDGDGNLVFSRPLLPKEKQKTFMSQLRAEKGTLSEGKLIIDPEAEKEGTND